MWFSFENGCYFTQKRTPADQVVLRPFQILLVLKALALITKCHRRGEGWVSMLRCLNRAKGTLESSGRSAVLKRVATGAAAAVQVIAGAQYGTITWCILAPVVLSAMLTCWWHRGRNLAARSYGLLEIFHFTPIHIIIFFFGAVQVASCQILAFVLCLKLYLSFDKMIAKNDFIQFASCRPSKTQHINKLRLSERNACHCSPLLGLSFPANLSYSFPFLHKLFCVKWGGRWRGERGSRRSSLCFRWLRRRPRSYPHSRRFERTNEASAERHPDVAAANLTGAVVGAIEVARTILQQHARPGIVGTAVCACYALLRVTSGK